MLFRSVAEVLIITVVMHTAHIFMVVAEATAAIGITQVLTVVVVAAAEIMAPAAEHQEAAPEVSVLQDQPEQQEIQGLKEPRETRAHKALKEMLS